MTSARQLGSTRASLAEVRRKTSGAATARFEERTAKAVFVDLSTMPIEQWDSHARMRAPRFHYFEETGKIKPAV
jgi:hypothetical protein